MLNLRWKCYWCGSQENDGHLCRNCKAWQREALPELDGLSASQRTLVISNIPITSVDLLCWLVNLSCSGECSATRTAATARLRSLRTKLPRRLVCIVDRALQPEEYKEKRFLAPPGLSRSHRRWLSSANEWLSNLRNKLGG